MKKEEVMDDFDAYDKICSLVYVELWNYAQLHNNTIQLKDFDPKDFDCRLVYGVARNLQNVYGFNIIIEGKKLQFLFKRKYKNVKIVRRLEEGIDIPTLVNHIFEFCEMPKDIVKDIVSQYYKELS